MEDSGGLMGDLVLGATMPTGKGGAVGKKGDILASTNIVENH